MSKVVLEGGGYWSNRLTKLYNVLKWQDYEDGSARDVREIYLQALQDLKDAGRSNGTPSLFDRFIHNGTLGPQLVYNDKIAQKKAEIYFNAEYRLTRIGGIPDYLYFPGKQ